MHVSAGAMNLSTCCILHAFAFHCQDEDEMCNYNISLIIAERISDRQIIVQQVWCYSRVLVCMYVCIYVCPQKILDCRLWIQ